MLSKSVSNLQRLDCHGLVVGTLLNSQSISQSDQSIDLEFCGAFFPSSDGKESSNQVSVDSEELITTISSVNSAKVEQAGLCEVVPIFLLESMVDKFVDVIIISISSDGENLHISDLAFSLEHPFGGQDAANKEESQDYL